jgi:superfamily I DNA and/or RNA helicase
MAKEQKKKSKKAVKPRQRENRSAKLASGKEAILDRYGGLQFGETIAKPSLRMKEIDKLEAAFRSPLTNSEKRESIQRRLCELKGIYFDEYDDPNDWKLNFQIDTLPLTGALVRISRLCTGTSY